MLRPREPTGFDAPWGCVPDVEAGEWSIAWNASDGVGRLGLGIPKSDFWASAKEGIDQVGCVYTAQGFEFDHFGVIVGPDRVYRPMDWGWDCPRRSYTCAWIVDSQRALKFSIE